MISKLKLDTIYLWLALIQIQRHLQ